MKKLLKYWRENKQKILIAIGVIVFVWICIQVANEFVKQEKENIDYFETNSTTVQDITKPNESVITDSKLNDEEVEENAQIIKKFVQYCNEKKIEEAYKLLSEDCKQEVYVNSNIFTNYYVNNIFANPKTYQLELWSANSSYDTYRITYLEGNALQTGGYTSSNNFIDYITIIKQGKDLKLNINKFVNKQNLNKTGISENIEIIVNSRSIYIDYETYNITVKNNTEKNIILNDGKTQSNLCLLDNMNNEYNSLIHELPTNSFIINSQYQNTFNIKFNKIYNATTNIKYLQIKDIYLDKEQYDISTNKEDLTKTMIKIKL